jgi:predicted lipoprotein with Yx(FWY)xxD motif
MKRKITLLAAPLAIALIVAGCGSSSTPSASSPGGYGSAMPASSGHRAVATPTLGIGNSPLGRILVDSKGSTLYLFEGDKRPASTCYGSCATNWPPVTVDGKVAAGRGVLAGGLGTTKRKDGQVEVTYHGHPLYRYAGDTRPGDINGQALKAFGAEWYVVAPSGNKIDAD